MPAITFYRGLPRSEKDAAPLVSNVWALDLNIESHETIKQWCFSV